MLRQAFVKKLNNTKQIYTKYLSILHYFQCLPAFLEYFTFFNHVGLSKIKLMLSYY